MRMVTRKDWGARPAENTAAFPGPFLGLSVHWEGPKTGPFPHTSCAARVRGIQNYHMNTRKWSDIAYNWLVCPHGYIFVGRGSSLQSAANGYPSVNKTWKAVCYLGGVGDPFTYAAQVAILELRDMIKAPSMNCHSDHKATECPGNIIRAWVKSNPKLVVPPTPPDLEEITMFLVDDPSLPDDSKNKQWLCDAHTKRHVGWDEFVGLLAMGLFHWEEKPETIVTRGALLLARKDVTP